MMARLSWIRSRLRGRPAVPTMPTDFAPLPRRDGWVQRIMIHPSTTLKIARAPWKDAPDLPGYSSWQSFVATLDAATRARVDDDTLRMYMTRGLVDEIIFAAGGIERELEVLRETAKIAQAMADAFIAAFPDAFHQAVAQSVETRTGGNASHHAAYAVMNALSWIRGVRERVSHTFRGRQVGLLPSLKDGERLKAKIQASFDQNLEPALQDARKFDNYVLHAGAIHGGGTPGYFIRPDQTVYFRFPDDPSAAGITTWHEFRYTAGRDALNYLEQLFETVATFIDDLLDAFDAEPL
ncbi:hypothetical protein SKC41_26440 [Mycobacterium sp. 050128]|uniref:hypothetical protein n=1 Tax=Mycobacterium sp. 050128 TaxID=3096112 RepID=UPI002EDB22C6